MCVKQPAEGENGEHLRRKEGICHRHAQLTAAHPVIIILGIGTHFIRQTGVGLFPLVKCLDNLDTVDVLDHSAAHFRGGLDRTCIVLCIVAHDHHHKEKCDGEHCQ